MQRLFFLVVRYIHDIAPADCLVVKLLRSPHAHAWIEDISVAAALKVPGIPKRFYL